MFGFEQWGLHLHSIKLLQFFFPRLCQMLPCNTPNSFEPLFLNMWVEEVEYLMTMVAWGNSFYYHTYTCCIWNLFRLHSTDIYILFLKELCSHITEHTLMFVKTVCNTDKKTKFITHGFTPIILHNFYLTHYTYTNWHLTLTWYFPNQFYQRSKNKNKKPTMTNTYFPTILHQQNFLLHYVLLTKKQHGWILWTSLYN